MRTGLATRLYRGDAGVNVIGRRKIFFAVAGACVLIAILSFALRGFTLGIEFKGGTQFQLPASVGTLQQVQDTVTSGGAKVVSAQTLGGTNPQYLIRTGEVPAATGTAILNKLSTQFHIPSAQISENQVSGAWGAQVTRKALYGLAVFLALVIVYLIIRFEARMAVAAVCSLALDLVVTAAVYSLVGFEVTPSTIIGFLTILGFALYDVVVVFDKVQENTRGITGGSNQTYAEAANLAVNQTLMRSINTGLVALLPVGGLLFIGAGLLGAGTLKDLGLVLFIGMGTAVYSSIFFATPVLVTLKEREPRYVAHTQRVLAKRAAVASRAAGGKEPVTAGKGRTPKQAAEQVDPELAALAGAAPKVGSRPAAGKRSGGSRSGGRGGRPGGGRPSGGAKRR